ncbi:hypothetical protein [Mucilaginibacter lappiensis]|uniref:Uncharacterized protein n=1 Tax=Mucilaginibacter lappiensis TaxID=354630 RepID=A0A1N7FQC5_9SPHI|nr:hypothetical protein [Mucilaginibacter lappiensis]MBB6112509.1 hypothetical protein [Mucilaginibacter lappiensis]MBB6129239.1 hypothetical protein [Mucilaginibacter lappiensis]SIS02539.1 hypothetical protein SAMN05421821_11943 [Mucilaginibacter lappiensis]
MKTLLLTLICACFIQVSLAQSPGPVERKLTDSLCKAISKLDLSKIQDGKAAKAAFMECFMQQSAMFIDLAEERHVSMEDDNAMHQIGTDIGKNLFKQKCDGFLKLAVKMADKENNTESESVNYTEGSFKRIDNKGFNYMVITDNSKSEKSFIWLRQFPGSESFMNSVTPYVGKKVNIKWQEMEVYLPQAKGYYKVKEILAVDIL